MSCADSDEEFLPPETPPEIVEAASNLALNLLPSKSIEKYEFAYKRFMDFRRGKNTESFSENVVITYFADLAVKLKASTLWANYSMLKSTLMCKENVDITKYHKLRAFLKRQSDGYKAKKSQVFNKLQIQQFISRAPDETFLITKVACIFGIFGACRRDELARMTINDIEDLGSKILINIPDNKTKTPRSFIVNESYLEIYRKYTALRPINFDNFRFFYKYYNGRSYRQVVGIHQFGKMPETIATFLNLPNPKQYTDHCFRRSSATILVDNGADLTCLKRHGGWKSSTVAEGYIEESVANKTDVANRIFGIQTTEKFEINDSCTSTNNSTSATKVMLTSSTNNSNHNPPIFHNCTNCNITVNITNNNR